MTFLFVALGSLAGTFLGNLGLFWVIGKMAQNAEKKKLEDLKKLQQGYLKMVEKERTRIEKYAAMEG